MPVELRTDPPTTAVCLAYVADRSNPQGYAGALTLDQQAAIITRAAGLRGPNHEYVLGVVAKLREAGQRDAELEALGDKVLAGLATGPEGGA